MSASAFKTVNRFKTKRLVQPITATTTASAREIAQIVLNVENEGKARAKQRVAAKERKGKVARWLDTSTEKDHITVYHVDGIIHVSYPREYNSCGNNAGPWTARLTAIPLTNGGCEVTCQLLRWVTADKALKNEEEYLWFLDRLGEHLSRAES